MSAKRGATIHPGAKFVKFAMTQATTEIRPDEHLLTNLGTGLRCAVIGASGGIGGALVRHLARLEHVAHVYAMSRREIADLPEKCTHVIADFAEPDTLNAAADRCTANGPLDLVLVATGLLHDGDGVSPEKDWRHLDADMMARVFHVNAIGPALAAKAFLPILKRDAPSVFAVLGARVGSISDNRLGGWYAYRASKAALSMIVANLAIELKRKRRGTIAVALHPGTVDSELSKPFQSSTKPGQVVTPDTSAAHLLGVITNLGLDDSGGHFAWDGARIPA